MISIYRSETSASLRRIPMWLVASDGTSAPATQAGGQPQINWLARGTATVNTGATLSLVSVNAGEYYVELSASEVSALGIASVQYRAATVCPASTYFQIANFDSGNSQDLGLAAWSVVTLAPGTHSNVTIKGIQNYANISSVTLNPTEYSNVTVRLGLVAYSGATVEVSNIARASMQSMADSFLRRALAMGADTGRSVQDAIRVLRNRVEIAGSIGTVFTEDDATSAFTFSVTTSASASPIIGVNPAGP